ncbi:MAG: glutamate racemase [Acidimicrobiales bacterium]
MDDRPIGVFDSGFGGLSVVRALIDLAPGEELVYAGDTGRYPYGPRPLAEVAAFAGQIARWLVGSAGVKMVVVACNTASAAALDLLRFELEVPVLGVIEPGLAAALRATRNHRVGVIGTVGTIESGAYQRAAQSARSNVELCCVACPGLVELVEEDRCDGPAAHALVEALCLPLGHAGVDTLLLGCTHYPFLARTIADVMGRGVVLVSSAEETAFEVRQILAQTGLGRRSAGKAEHHFYSSGDPDAFVRLGSQLLGPELDRVEVPAWD